MTNIRAIEAATHLVAEGWIDAAPAQLPHAIGRREYSRGGTSSLGEQISGFRDSFNKDRGLTAIFDHRKGVVTWAANADYVRSPRPAATVAAQQLSFF